MNETEFLTTISQLDILCIAESHIGQNQENIEMDGFDHFPGCRRASNNNRFFGGLAIYTKKILCPGIKLVKSNNPEIAWLKADRNFVGLEKDTYISFVYMPPYNSPYLQRTGQELSSLYRQME